MPPCDIYARVFENAQTGLLLLERDTGRILEVNAAFLRMAGRGCTEVVGRSFWAPPLVADVDAGAEIHGHLLAGDTVTGAELPLQAGDGRRLLLEVSGSAASGLIQLEVRDATGREQARLAERLEMLRLLAGRTAAEFHNLHRLLRTTGELLLIHGAGQGRPVPGELEGDPAGQRTGQRHRRAVTGIQRRDRPPDPAGRPQRSRGKHVAQVAAAIRAGYRNRPGSEPGYGARDGRPRPGAADHLEPGRQFAGGDGARRHLLPPDRQLANRGAGVREH